MRIKSNKVIAGTLILILLLSDCFNLERALFSYAEENNKIEQNVEMGQTTTEENQTTEKNNNIIYKGPIYANIRNDRDGDYKYDNFFEYNVEREIKKEDNINKLIYEDKKEILVENENVEEKDENDKTKILYKKPTHLTINYVYEDGKYKFSQDKETYYEQDSSQAILKSYMKNLQDEGHKFYRIAMDRDLFITNFGENGYIDIYNENGNKLGQLNINSKTNICNEIYIDLSDALETCRIETNKINEKFEFKLRSYEKGEIEEGITILNSLDDTLVDNEEKNIVYNKTEINKDVFNQLLGESGYINIYSLNEEIIDTGRIDDDESEYEGIDEPDADEYVGSSGMPIVQVNKKEELVATINASTELDTNNNYVITYQGNIDKIKLETSEIVGTGKLLIKNTKEILKEGSLRVSNWKIKNALRERRNETVIKKDNTKNTTSIATNYKLINTITDTNLKIDKQSIPAMGAEEDVKFTISLNNEEYTSDLFKNPVFYIELPDGIENVNIKSGDVLFDTELKIKNADVIEFNNHKTIRVELEGRETKYINSSITSGTTIILTVGLTAEKLLTRENNTIGLYTYNEYATDNKNKVEVQMANGYVLAMNYSSVSMDFIAPNGFFLINGVENYDGAGSNIYTDYEENKMMEATIPIYSKEINITQKQMIVNNSGAKCQNVCVLGRTINKNNEDLKNGVQFETNIDTTLLGGIEVNKEDAKVYYSEKANTTADMSETNNWQTNVSDWSKIKSYMVVLNDIDDKQIIEISYKAKIPAQLEYFSDMYTNFAAKYTPDINVQDNMELKLYSNTIKITTGKGPKMNISMEASVADGETVNERERIKYTIKVENTGSMEITNMKISDVIPDGTIYTEYVEKNSNFEQSGYITDSSKRELVWNIDRVEVGEVVIREFELVISDLPTIEEYYGSSPNFTKINDEYYLIETDEITGEQKKTKIDQVPDLYIENHAEVTADMFNINLSSNYIKNKINRTYLEIEENSSYTKEASIREKQEYQYDITITNKQDEKLNNISATKILPEGLELVEAYQIKNGQKVKQANYDETTGRINWTIDQVDRKEVLQLVVRVQTKELETGLYEKKIKTKTVVVDQNGREYISNTVENTVAKPKVNIEITKNPDSQYIKEGANVSYKVKVENLGKIVLDGLKITDILPKELKCKSITYKKGSVDVESTPNNDGNVEVKANLAPGEKLELEIVVTTGELDKSKNEIEITNLIKVEANGIESVEEKISQIIEVAHNQDDNKTSSYKIKGIAWIDTNKNGKREKTEEIVQYMPVYLMDDNGNIVKETKTDIVGEYAFENVKTGNYFVIFLYDYNTYDLTTYQAKEVSTQYNSDVVQTDINFNGQIIQGAITNVISLNSRSELNIDIGLITKPEFDLTLTKTIAEAYVKSPQSEKQYNYNNSDFAKLDIKAKEISKASVIVKYNITITNTGDLTGQVSKIVDYKPEKFDFSSELNPNWYVTNDGGLYNRELAGQDIAPGESKTVTLTLTTKNIGERALTLENTAQIIEYYNERGIKDKNENNQTSKATMLITIATGAEFVYITVVIGILVITAGIIYIVKRKRIKPKKRGVYK